MSILAMFLIGWLGGQVIILNKDNVKQNEKIEKLESSKNTENKDGVKNENK